jgi:hypothetical protein
MPPGEKDESGERIYRYMGFVPLRRRAYLILLSTLLATSLIILILTVFTRAIFGELGPWLRASQLMLIIGSFFQAAELVTLLRGR